MLNLDIADLLRLFLIFVIAITVHEFSHALVATWLGDDTPGYQGRLTLSPLAHLDPIGTIMLAVAGFGWGRPVQVNPSRLKFGPSVGMGLVAAAGPASNVLLAAISAASYLFVKLVLGAMTQVWQDLFFALINVNVMLAIFNLIPVFPLDGFSITLGLLRLVRGRIAYQITQLMYATVSYGPMLLLGILVLNNFVPILSVIIQLPTLTIIRFLARL